MIKRFKYFKESINDEQSFKEIIDSVKDILSGLKYEGHIIKITRVRDDLVLSIVAQDGNHITCEDFKSVLQVHEYLINEDFSPIGDNINNEMDIIFKMKKLLRYPLGRFKHFLETMEKFGKNEVKSIQFSYRMSNPPKDTTWYRDMTI